MLTMNVNYEVMQDRLVTIKLPEDVQPGLHDLVVVINKQSMHLSSVAVNNVAALSDFVKKRYELSLIESVTDAEEIFTKMASRHVE